MTVDNKKVAEAFERFIRAYREMERIVPVMVKATLRRSSEHLF